MNPSSGRTTDTVIANWNKPAGTVTGYVIQYATDAGFTQNAISQNLTTNYFSKTGFTKNKTYYFRVQAINQTGASPWSSVVSKPMP